MLGNSLTVIVLLLTYFTGCANTRSSPPAKLRHIEVGGAVYIPIS